MKKQIKKLAVLVFMGLIASCTQPELQITEENVSESKIEIIQDGKMWGFLGDGEWGNPTQFGVFGPSNVDALVKATYNYVADPVALKQIPPDQRGFRIRILRQDAVSPTGWETALNLQELSSSVVTLKFPSYGELSTTKWKIGISMYNKSNNTSFLREKEVTVNNK
ncbi:hypothetical protein SAMN04487910_1193 [Aquimarina amphilecti]|uniref:Lipoprotein n=1 Tax=Aquimarina amphilecti TaxID=1038014 RepID=A0A1H7K666_AQUAM|nr:hypothetical protein [Aquimarina amphilecti]SEK81405.1 hypothetical protein SAMN04487910_1193 [Aquimarina amphilecti]